MHGFKVVQRGGIDAGLHHRRLVALVGLFELGSERAVVVVQIPVPGFGEHQTLRCLEADRVDVGDEHQEAGEVLSTLDDAELSRLLD